LGGGYDRTHGDRSVSQLAVIEDCAQSTGAEWMGLKWVALDIGCFSFYPESGIVVMVGVTTNDPAIAAKMRMLREHGKNSLLPPKIGVNI